MNYLILINGDAFYTNWFDVENNYIDGMVVFNILSDSFTTDGQTWKEINEDSL